MGGVLTERAGAPAGLRRAEQAASRQEATGPRAREFLLTDADFERIRELIYRHAGIKLSEAKRQMVYSRLVRRLRELGMTSFSEYLACIERGDGSEWQRFVNSLTTNLTAFFREPHHFPLLAQHLGRRNARVPAFIWSAACSTGEEAYSIAMTVVERFGFDTPVRILATDLDTQVLEVASEGVYPMERLSGVPESRLRRFFLRGSGAAAGKLRVRPELRRLVAFRQLNLLDEGWPLSRSFDAIFCRNVMIYFDKPTQRKVLERMFPLLHEDGLLFVGHSESLHHVKDLYTLCGRTVYRRA